MLRNAEVEFFPTQGTLIGLVRYGELHGHLSAGKPSCFPSTYTLLNQHAIKKGGGVRESLLSYSVRGRGLEDGVLGL